MNKLESLSIEWSLIDGQGLVRVVPVDTFRTGFVLGVSIGQAAEKLDYYPELTLAREKVTITIDDQDEKKAFQLAEQIDTFLVRPPDAPTDV